jgi:CHAT domain
MKYPGLPPAGDAQGGPGWELAGTDLPGAVEALRRRPGVQLAEALRRAGEAAEALRVLENVPAIDDSGRSRALVEFARANIWWAVGDGGRGRAHYEHARNGWAAAGDREGVAAATLGLARCLRIQAHRSGHEVVRTAADLAEVVGEPHLVADARREQAAWALLHGNARVAMALADEAAATHRAAGDRYLTAFADILRARALFTDEEREAAVGLMRRQRQVGRELGSADVEMVASVYLGQFLQYGVTPDSPDWWAAEEILTDALERADDPFTRAELLLPLAQLYTSGARIQQARSYLDEYERLYQALGGNQIAVGNLAKARARLALAEHGGLSFRSLRRAPATLRTLTRIRRDFRRAERAYREAGLEPGVQSVRWHISLVDVIAGGGTTGVPIPQDTRDRLGQARSHLLNAELMRAADRLAEARGSYAAAEEQASAAGSTTLAVAAAAGLAEVGYMAGDYPGALAAVRSAVRYTEAIRAAVADGSARGHIAKVLRGHYERATLLAARMGDGDLVLELIERLRTERLAGLLRSRVDQVPNDLARLLAALNQVNEALAQRLEPGVRSVRSGPAIADLHSLGVGELERRRQELLDELAERTTELFAGTYDAERLDMASVTDLAEHVLALVPMTIPQVTEDDDVVVSVWRSPEGQTDVAVLPVNPDLIDLRRRLLGQGREVLLERIALGWRDLHPIQAVIPDGLRAALTTAAAPVPLVVVPTDWLWAIPFAAIPVAGAHDNDSGASLLVDHADVVLAPSLRVYKALRSQTAASEDANGAVSWAAFEAAELEGLDSYPDGHIRLADSQQVREAFVHGGRRWTTAVLAAHGNREPGLAQAILDANWRAVLTAADYLTMDAQPPRRMSLATCHSGFPDSGSNPHEPLGLALTALTAGAQEIISAQYEIDAGSPVVTECLRRLYAEMAIARRPASVLAQIQRDPTLRTQPLSRWAVLAVIGG